VTLDVAIASVLFLVGAVSAVRSLGQVDPADTFRVRLLVTLHGTARSGFWIGLGAYFAGLAFLEEPRLAQWILVVPVVMAGARMITGYLLANVLPRD
jgi:hypothetical protein